LVGIHKIPYCCKEKGDLFVKLKTHNIINKISTTKISEYLLIFIVCLSISFIYKWTALSENNLNYGVEEIHAHNNHIFQNNINTIGSEYSPRLYANLFMTLLIKILGSSWNGAALVLIQFNYVLYAIAITIITTKIAEKNKLLVAAILSICFMGGSLLSLAFEINCAQDVFLGTAIPLALIALGLIIGEKKNWDLAWIFLALSEFMHVHEGLWAGCIVVIFWLAMCIYDKKLSWKSLRTIPIYILSVFMVVVPSLLHTESVDESLFNQIYVFIRTPHHLLLSNWGVEKIVVATGMVAVAALIIFVNMKIRGAQSRDRNLMVSALLLVLFWIALLLLEYISTEVFSISAVVTMYVTKCFKYITYLSVLVFAAYGNESISKGKYIEGISLFTIILIPYNYGKWSYLAFCVLVIIYILSVCMHFDDKVFIKKDKSTGITCLLSYLLLMFMMWAGLRHSRGEYTALYLILIFAIILITEFLLQEVNIKKITSVIIACLAVISLIQTSNGFIFNISRTGFSRVTGTDYVKALSGNELYQLAIEFQNVTDEDTVFLADPDSSQSNSFQLISQRNCYCLYKNTPSKKNSVIEWYDRIVNVRKMTTCSAEELKELLREIGIDYVLVTSDRYSTLEESGLFEVLAKNESLGVYYLND
jgi:hypothetical protein